MVGLAVVKGGRIVEQGTHKQLMALPDGAYSALAKMQMGGPEASKPARQGTFDDDDTEKQAAAVATLEATISPQQSLEKQV